MNGTSFLLLLVFMVAGYVIHPMVLPKLQAKGYVAETPALENNARDGSENATSVPRQIAELGEEIKVDGQREMPEVKAEEVIVPAPMPEPTPTPTPTPTPAPAPFEQETQPELEEANGMTDEQLVESMKHSVRSGEVAEFKVDQVVEWKMQGKKTFNGVEYEEGLVTYKAQTLFGAQELEAIALIQQGKVVKWLWAATDTEMK